MLESSYLACPECAVGKGSNRPPVGLPDRCLSLRDPGPTSPWTLSQAYPRLVAIRGPHCGRPVLKAVHFIPSPNYPARETAVIVFDHVFRIHGLPVDVVSDSGPQFTSRFGQSSVDYGGDSEPILRLPSVD